MMPVSPRNIVRRDHGWPSLSLYLCRAAVAVAVISVVACDDPERRSRATAAAEALEAERVKARADAAARVEAGRLAALWTYFELPVGQARQLTAAIRSANNIDAGGEDARAAMLVFRDHPSWGRSSYIVLENGAFVCGRCRVTVVAGDGPAVEMPAHRPPTDDAIAIFIDNEAQLWTITNEATSLAVTFAVKGGRRETARFDVGGLDAARMPGW